MLINRGRNKRRRIPAVQFVYKPTNRTLHDRLKDHCIKNGLSQWMVIEEAVAEFLERQERVKSTQ